VDLVARTLVGRRDRNKIAGGVDLVARTLVGRRDRNKIADGVDLVARTLVGRRDRNKIADGVDLVAPTRHPLVTLERLAATRLREFRGGTTTVHAGQAGRPRSILAPAVRATSVGILILITLIAFEAMAVNAALPTAARELDGLGAYGWAFTGFLVANVVGMVVSGQYSDRAGAARPLLAGLAAFTAGLVVGGTATTMAQLIAGRVVQGFGAGLIITAVYVVIGQLYPDELRPKLFAAISSAWVVPGLIGPPVSGLLAEHVTWRLVFLGLAPFVVLGGLLLVPVLRTLHRPSDPAPIDRQRIPRALAVAGGVAAFTSAGQHPSLAAGAVALVGVVAMVWGLRRLLPAGTIRVRPGVAAPIALRGLFAGAFFGMESLVPLSLTVQHDFGPFEAGLPLTVTGTTWFLGSWWQGRRVADDGTARRVRLMRVGFVLVAGSAVGMAITVLPSSPGWLAYPVWGLGGFGAGLTMASIGILLLRYTSDETRGNDSAALQLSDGTSAAITTAIGGILVAAATRGALSDTTAFVTVFAVMAVVAITGAAVAHRARPAASVGAGQPVSVPAS
jgi:MFS family permease